MERKEGRGWGEMIDLLSNGTMVLLCLVVELRNHEKCRLSATNASFLTRQGIIGKGHPEVTQGTE